MRFHASADSRKRNGARSSERIGGISPATAGSSPLDCWRLVGGQPLVISRSPDVTVSNHATECALGRRRHRSSRADRSTGEAGAIGAADRGRSTASAAGVAAAPAAKPAWLRFAVPAPPTGNRPLVAIVFDDLGLDRARTAEAIRLRGPLTMSFMTYANDLVASRPRQRGAPATSFFCTCRWRRSTAMPIPVRAGCSRRCRARRTWRGCAGARPHSPALSGSTTTWAANLPPMRYSMMPVMEELRARGLVFLDLADLALQCRDLPRGRLRGPARRPRRVPRRRPGTACRSPGSSPGSSRSRPTARQRHRYRPSARHDDRCASKPGCRCSARRASPGRPGPAPCVTASEWYAGAGMARR